MLTLVWICRGCNKYDEFDVKKKTHVKSVNKRAGALHRSVSPRCKKTIKDLAVMSAFEAHCGGLID